MSTDTYAVRVRGGYFQVVPYLYPVEEGADAFYKGPAGLGVGEFLPAGCTLIGLVAGRGEFNTITGKYSGYPELSPAPPSPPPPSTVKL